MERPQFENDHIYHIFNRGVEKRDVFLNNKDYFRFIHDMFEFNDQSPALNLGYNLLKSDFNRPRKLLVEILCFCLMPNHYHFMLRQKVDGGITEFMRKIGTGYTNYFNLKNKRVGVLFQGKFKAVHIEKEAHLLYLPHYIHLNPLDLAFPEWREQKIKSVSKALQFLKTYQWSSYLDYINIKNFPSITQRDFLTAIYRSPTSIMNYEKDIKEWLEDFDFESVRDISIDY